MTLYRLFLLFVVCSFAACQDDDDFVEPEGPNPGMPEDVPGLYFGEERGGDFATLYDSLITLIDASDLVSVVAEVDHRINASTVGTTLPPTRVVLFSSPSQSTPLMEANLQAGLDLPQKVLVYEAEDGDVFMAFDVAQYYSSRYDIEGVSTLNGMTSTTFNLIRRAGINGEILPSGAFTVQPGEGIITHTAAGSVDSVYTALRSALESNAAITIVAEVDHQADAATVDVQLPPSRLIVFGNPNLGTPLMVEARTIGIDLPQKMLVYESAAGEVTIAYNDPFFLADRHDVDGDLPQLSTISDALEGLARGALGL